jgi:hypothetical protein
MAYKKRTKEQMDLLIADLEEYLKQNPNEDKHNLKELQRYHRKVKGMEGHENAPEGAIKYWQIVTANPEDPENPIKTTAYAGVVGGSEELAEVFTPAEAARITPTKRKRANR